MARIYQALQRHVDGRWVMTVSSDEEHWLHAVGYCSGPFDLVWPPYSGDSNTFGFLGKDDYERHREKEMVFRNRYHTAGHETAEEAEACYLEYAIDHRRSFIATSGHRCAFCMQWTDHHVEIGETRLISICPEHETPENIRVALRQQEKRRK
jgi:hypothetical protein